MVGVGLLMVYSAKTQAFPALSAALARGELLDLNQVSKPEQLLPFLQVFQDEAERRAVAKKVFDYLSTHRPLPNVGALARLRSAPRVPLLPLAKLKPAFVVRTPVEFQQQFLIWIALYLAAFHVVFLIWRWSGYAGRFRDSARDSSAHRHGPDSRGEPARSAARYARVQQIRVGRGAGLRWCCCCPCCAF
jgi:hypothetical protein